MNSEIKKTLIFVVAALVLTGAAFFKLPDRSGKSTEFNDQGTLFFPEFKDPNTCTDLEVVEFDPSTASTSEFKVMYKDNRWVIPSHNNYPADAKDRLSKTAGSLIDLKKDTIRSDRVEDHEALGVLDPRELKGGLKGRGKRITLKDQSERTLADFIIGEPVRDHPTQRYVRVPGQKRVYGVEISAEPSTRFADWIETNLLQLEASKLKAVKVDHTRFDPAEGRLIEGEIDRIEKPKSSATWKLDDAIPPGEELNTETVNALTAALADLKIVGIRVKPEGLSRELKSSTGSGIVPTSNTELRSLVAKGFYPTDKGFFSDQGEVIASTVEGAVYTLRFGEAVFATGDALTAGSEAEAKAKGEEKPSEGTTENRYLLVTVAFDPELVPIPEKPVVDVKIPDDPFQKKPDDPKRIAEEKAAQEVLDKEKADRETQLADAKKKVDALSERFADWYYVTTGDSFRKISVDKTALIRPIPEKPAGQPETGGNPFQGLPPGVMPNFPQ